MVKNKIIRKANLEPVTRQGKPPFWFDLMVNNNIIKKANLELVTRRGKPPL